MSNILGRPSAQAVNSLVTALKLPDESARPMKFWAKYELPAVQPSAAYRDYNQESGLFMNDTTMGFMLEAIPSMGRISPLWRPPDACCAPNCRAVFRCVSI